MPKAIEWYRPVMTRKLLRIIVPSALITLTAALTMGGGFLVRDETTSALLILLGIVLAIIGPTAAAWGIISSLKHDVYLSLRTDGIQFHDEDGSDSFIGWNELNEAAAPDEHTLELRVDEGEPLVVREQWIGIATADLAKRIAELQRKALLGVPLR